MPHAALAPPSGGAGPDPSAHRGELRETPPADEPRKSSGGGRLVCGPGPITTSGASILTQTCSDRQACTDSLSVRALLFHIKTPGEERPSGISFSPYRMPLCCQILPECQHPTPFPTHSHCPAITRIVSRISYGSRSIRQGWRRSPPRPGCRMRWRIWRTHSPTNSPR